MHHNSSMLSSKRHSFMKSTSKAAGGTIHITSYASKSFQRPSKEATAKERTSVMRDKTNFAYERKKEQNNWSPSPLDLIVQSTIYQQANSSRQSNNGL